MTPEQETLAAALPAAVPAAVTADASQPSARRATLVALWLLSCVACYLGWRLFWFLADDGFIAFRYVSNRQLGYGYVWNAPPFLPVEGYSSFSWLLLLDAVWSLLGIEPPHAANTLSLGCALLSLLLVALWFERSTLAPRPLWLTAWALVLVVSNRSFLVWASSGMETALFDLMLLAWTLLAWQLAGRESARTPWLAALALLLSLTRPDGLLFWAITLALVIALRFTRTISRRAFVRSALCLLGTPLHVLWRHAFYGTWLPNPYYAKVVGAWPEAGARFLAAFALEYGLWLSLPIIGYALVRERRALGGGAPALRGGATERAISPPPYLWIRAAALTAVLAHVGYYALIVGGDHFEYRVLTQLVPLLALVWVWAVERLTARALFAHALCALLLLVQSAIPWTHWRLTHQLWTRTQTSKLIAPVAPALPAALAPITAPFDQLQAWLISRGIAVRHQEHKVFALHQLSQFPSREQGLALVPRQVNPVLVYPCVGVPGWTLPRIALLDSFGLNDYVIARTPLPAGARHYMAHERIAPPGYLQAFSPDIQFTDASKHARLIELQRSVQLTDARVRAIEQRYRAIVDGDY